jgi:hypothetical protein
MIIGTIIKSKLTERSSSFEDDFRAKVAKQKLRSGTCKAGLPDFSWWMTPKPEKVPNGQKVYQRATKYPKCHVK